MTNSHTRCVQSLFGMRFKQLRHALLVALSMRLVSVSLDTYTPVVPAKDPVHVDIDCSHSLQGSNVAWPQRSERPRRSHQVLLYIQFRDSC